VTGGAQAPAEAVLMAQGQRLVKALRIILEAYVLFDRDGSGTIDRGEVLAMIENETAKANASMPGGTKKRTKDSGGNVLLSKERWMELDFDDSGEISFAEFVHAFMDWVGIEDDDEAGDDGGSAPATGDGGGTSATVPSTVPSARGAGTSPAAAAPGGGSSDAMPGGGASGGGGGGTPASGMDRTPRRAEDMLTARMTEAEVDEALILPTSRRQVPPASSPRSTSAQVVSDGAGDPSSMSPAPSPSPSHAAVSQRMVSTRIPPTRVASTTGVYAPSHVVASGPHTHESRPAHGILKGGGSGTGSGAGEDGQPPGSVPSSSPAVSSRHVSAPVSSRSVATAGVTAGSASSGGAGGAGGGHHAHPLPPVVADVLDSSVLPGAPRTPGSNRGTSLPGAMPSV